MAAYLDCHYDEFKKRLSIFEREGRVFQRIKDDCRINVSD